MIINIIPALIAMQVINKRRQEEEDADDKKKKEIKDRQDKLMNQKKNFKKI